MKVCKWSFNGDNIYFDRIGENINYDRIMAFLTDSYFRQLLHIKVWSCVILSTQGFQWNIFKGCIHLVSILRLCMWNFDEETINFYRIMAFKTYLFWAALFMVLGNCLL